MKKIKIILFLTLGSFLTFTILDYTLGEKLREKYAHIESLNSNEEDARLVRTFSHGKVNHKNLVAMQAQSPVNFNQNTYEARLDTNGKPQLKRGKRYYDETAMEEISTSANIEPIRRGDE